MSADDETRWGGSPCNNQLGQTPEETMSEIREKLLKASLKPEEISGDTDTKNARVTELVRWMARYTEGHANPKWLASHAAELAYYVAELKGL